MCVRELWQANMLNILFPFIYVLDIDIIIKETLGLRLLLSYCITLLSFTGLDKVEVGFYISVVLCHLLLISITVFGQAWEHSAQVSLFSRINITTAIIIFSHTEIAAALLVCKMVCFSQFGPIFVKYDWIRVHLYSFLHFLWCLHIAHIFCYCSIWLTLILFLLI